MNNSPTVFVVTPFHNTADYLAQCISSVLGQTYTNFQYLLFDNCSTDGSTEIAQSFAARDRRIRLRRFTELLPQIPNYNRALEHLPPEAEWCKIVQADDWLYRQCLERMVEVGSLDASIGLVAAYYLRGDYVQGCGLPVDVRVIDGQDACRHQLRGQFFFMGSQTTVMYRGSLVRRRRPFYSEKSYHPDTEVSHEILEHHKLGFVHEVLSYMRIGNPSISTSLVDFNPDVLDFLIVTERYADRFMPPVEARARKRAARYRYFMFLGESLLRCRRRDFWEYHRTGLLTINWNWSWTPVLVSAVLVAVQLLLNPLSTVARVWKQRTNLLHRPVASRSR